MYKTIPYSLMAMGAMSLLFFGCGNDTVEESRTNESATDIVKLAPQTGTNNYLFYGVSDHKGLGSLKSIAVIDPDNPTVPVVQNGDTSDIRRPVLNTRLEYNASSNSYSDLYVESVMYVSQKRPYKIAMKKGTEAPTQRAHSRENNTSGTGRGGAFSYTTIEYLGSKQYLSLKNKEGKQVLVTPDMEPTDAGLPFENKELLTLSYTMFGAAADGYIVHDSNRSELQKCTLDMSRCLELKQNSVDVDFIGDVGGDTLSALEIDKKYYRLNKATGEVEEVFTDVNASNISRTYFSGASIYFVKENGNISRGNIKTGVYSDNISKDGKADRIRAFTNDMVIYGPTDSEMYAVKKDGSSSEAITLAIATKTGGQKYTYSMAVGNQYIYNLFKLNTETGKVTFRACLLENEEIVCKDESMWAIVAVAKDGKFNFDSTIQYAPYAFIRVDDTDNYGGGTLKAIDPKHPMKDGITLGRTETFNFQTFVTREQTFANADGSLVLYAKNDLDYRSTAFYMNLNQPDSLVNISNEPIPNMADLRGERGHCHGRYCSVCHQFAGGKIYQDKNGTASAIGYNVRFEFEDGETAEAQVRKGEGENFNIPLEHIVGKNFTAVVFNEANKTVMNRSNEYSHRGAEYFNCNFCHGRRGALRHDAPNVITIEK